MDAADKGICMTVRLTMTAAVLGLLTLAGPATAASQADRDACTPDVFRLCSSEIPNASKIVACLNSKTSELSPGCRAVMNGGGDRSARAREQRRPASAAAD